MDKYVKKFIKSPSQKNLDRLELWSVYIIYGWVLYCIKNQTGKIELAKKLKKILLPSLIKNTCFDRNGANAILLACRTIAVNKLNRQKTSIVLSFNNENKSIEIYYDYDPKLPNMFLIKQTSDYLGVDKELMLYYEGLKEYIVDIFTNDINLKVDKISIIIQNKFNLFYTSELGVIWNMGGCADCVDKKIHGKEISKDCNKLLEEKCYEKFRYRPEYFFEKSDHIYKETKPIKSLIQTDFWTCEECLLQNELDLKRCKACKTKKN